MGAAKAPHQRQDEPHDRDGKQNHRAGGRALAHGFCRWLGLAVVGRAIQRRGGTGLGGGAYRQRGRGTALGAAVSVVRQQQAAVFAVT